MSEAGAAVMRGPCEGMLGKLGAWWPAEEEEESLLFKGVSNFFFSSTHPA
jgi:hypothetical protein